MVEQILDFAGANSGKKKYNFGRTSVAETLGEATAECRPLIDEKGIILEQEVSADLPEIRADRGALCQAIQNLIANSIKYGDGGRRIRVFAKNGGGGDKDRGRRRGYRDIAKRSAAYIRAFLPFEIGRRRPDTRQRPRSEPCKTDRRGPRRQGLGRKRGRKGSRFTIEIPAG